VFENRQVAEIKILQEETRKLKMPLFAPFGRIKHQKHSLWLRRLFSITQFNGRGRLEDEAAGELIERRGIDFIPTDGFLHGLFLR